jgi:hypothetical protein
MRYIVILFECYTIIKLDQAYLGYLTNGVYYYLPDLIYLPVLLGLSSSLLKKITNRFNSFSLLHVIAAAATCVTLVFEFILPTYSPIYTRDWMDGVMCFLGAILYYFITKKRVNNQPTHA